jgi:hypothetical protein
MKKLTLVLFLLIVLFSTYVYGNTSVIFTDNTNYWPGWGNSTHELGTPDNNLDQIGIPGFSGGVLTLDSSGRLLTLTIHQSVTSDPLWGVLSPGDLFIDANGDNTWDYVVKLANWNASGPSDPDPGPGNYNIYSIAQPLGSSFGYILSGQDNSGNWSGYYIRDSHPVGYVFPSSVHPPYGTVGFSGWGSTPSAQYVFDFGNGLPLGSDFTIGWAVNCANDVIYQNFDVSTPEPATMFLLGYGLIGLAAYGRKRFKR